MKHRMEEAIERARAGQDAPHTGGAGPRSSRKGRRAATGPWGQRTLVGAGLALTLALSGCGGSGGGSGASGGGGSTTSSSGGSGGVTGGSGGMTGGSGGMTGGSGGGTSTGGSMPVAGIGTLCPFGTECPATAPACISKGEGDATAYCSVYDCADDGGCPVGFYCGVVRDPHAICGANPPKGDNNFCGTTNDPCIDPSADSTSRFEGSQCLLRKACLYREQCAPCGSESDCSGRPYQKCATIGGESRCARECTDAGDCLDDADCQGGVCVPKGGSCKGTGQFCEPCLNDEDCGDASTTRACAGLSGGMRACFDFSFSTSCSTDLDCPTAPSGKHGACLDENYGLGPGDPQYHKCYLPIDSMTFGVSCW